MYLKSITLKNFRKFGDNDNTVEFIDSKDYLKEIKEDKVNIAPKTTLIIGNNNSGKTTVIEALKKLINGSKFFSNDFNLNYLNKIFRLYTPKYMVKEKIELPVLEFSLILGIDNNDSDYLTNIISFMSISDVNNSEIEINVRWELEDNQIFIKEVDQFLKEKYGSNKFMKFLELIDNSNYKISYYNCRNELRKDFLLKNLMELTSISANNITNSSCLSDAFQKIIEYRYKRIDKYKLTKEIGDHISKINEKFTKYIKENHTENINNILGKIALKEKFNILLRSDLTFQKLLKNLIKYEYVEGGNNVPEEQFGLGYTNFMMIISKIVEYMEKYPNTAFNSKINLISIEEPETFMHPQMQKQFILNINEMIASILDLENKNINSQIIITTHSSHLLDSKIHSGNTFNNINYITNYIGGNKSICLNDNIISGIVIDRNKKNTAQEIDNSEKLENLKFLKKHIKYHISEVFFADAVIFVEGITEYTLLRHYIDNSSELSKYHISLILIDGAHAKMYENLIKALNIPTIIITDIDFKRNETEKRECTSDKFFQIKSHNLVDRITTNKTLSHFYKTDKVEDIFKCGYKIIDNLMIIFQKDTIENTYSTSFEEAFMLTNHENKILKKVLNNIKPDIYKDIETNGGILNNSFKLQYKFSNSKTNFANTLLYEILILNDDEESLIPKLPNYILDGFNYLYDKLKDENNV